MKTKQSGLFADRKPNNSVPVLSVFSTVSSWPQSNVAFFKVQESLGNFRKHWPNSFDRLMSLVEWGRGGGRFFSGERPLSRGAAVGNGTDTGPPGTEQTLFGSVYFGGDTWHGNPSSSFGVTKLDSGFRSCSAVRVGEVETLCHRSQLPSCCSSWGWEALSSPVPWLAERVRVGFSCPLHSLVPVTLST